jgi:hypothetical protein
MALIITQKTETVKKDYHGVTLEIARANNHAFRAKFKKLRQSFKRNQDLNKLTVEQEDALMAEAYAGTVLVGWANFPGNVPFTEANAVDLLTNDIDAREFVAEVASDLSEFLLEEKAELVKKSATPTAGG